jgi:anthranilate synthase component 1
VAFFGNSEPTIIPLGLPGSQFEIYSQLEQNYSHTFLFESLTGPEELAETSIIGFDPQIIVQGFEDRIILQYKDGTTKTIPTNDPVSEIKNLIGQTTNTEFRYIGGAVGIINYDAIKLYENIPIKIDKSTPLMEFGIYLDGILYDNKTKKSLYFYYDKNRINEINLGKREFGRIALSDITTNMNEEKFTDIVNKAKKYVHDGDIFQVVLSRRFSFSVSGDYLRVYKELRALNPSPYLYHMKFEKTYIGCSPEMLVRITGKEIETFPIAGTRKITDDEEKNEQLKEELLNDEKEVAEHTMLVDLGRNDIGRVCEYGSVRVTELMQIKRFSHVQQH